MCLQKSNILHLLKLVLYLSFLHQPIHILRNLVIGYSRINLCSSNVSMFHHLAYTLDRDTSREHKRSEGISTIMIGEILLHTCHYAYLMCAVSYFD